jgi:aspartyl protease family protein
VNGAPPKTVAVGESFQGVKLVSLQAEQAVVELDGKRVNLRMDTPVSIGGGGGSGGGGSRIVLPADSRGHYMTQGAINGRTVTFMLDTGATSIALSAADAQRIGLDYSKAQRVQMSTANGVTVGYKLRLQSVRVGDVEVYDIDAIVSPRADALRAAGQQLHQPLLDAPRRGPDGPRKAVLSSKALPAAFFCACSFQACAAVTTISIL